MDTILCITTHAVALESLGIPELTPSRLAALVILKIDNFGEF